MTTKRFRLKSFNFKYAKGVIYDNLNDEELELSIYELVDLLNKVSKPEYTLLRFRDDVYNKIDEVMHDE